VAFAASDAPQGELAAVTSPYGPPGVTAIELNVIADAPAFFTEIVCVGPVVFTTTLPRLEVAETVSCANAAAEEHRPMIAISDS
jgi:hypothetical protein